MIRVDFTSRCSEPALDPRAAPALSDTGSAGCSGREPGCARIPRA
jgi:hypothetical protein